MTDASIQTQASAGVWVIDVQTTVRALARERNECANALTLNGGGVGPPFEKNQCVYGVNGAVGSDLPLVSHPLVSSAGRAWKRAARPRWAAPRKFARQIVMQNEFIICGSRPFRIRWFRKNYGDFSAIS